MNNNYLEEFLLKAEMKLSEISADSRSELEDIVRALEKLKNGKAVEMEPLEQLVTWVYYEDLVKLLRK